jgi:hypothetical protein
MSNFQNLLVDIQDKVEEMLKGCELVHDLSKLGLDQRAAYSGIYVDLEDEEFVAVAAGSDRILQYYGGFEYIDKEYRHELGNYVFYMTENDGEGRVNRCFETLKMSKMTPEELEKYREKQEELEEQRYKIRKRGRQY